MEHYGDLADALLPHVLKAGRVIMSHYRQGGEVATKAGGFPVTEADHDAEAVLLEALARIAPGVPVVAEEMMEGQAAAAMGSEFFLVDPLDGTREFIEGRDEFTVNVGLIRDRSPTFGVIYAPALDLLYMTIRSDFAISARVAPGAEVAKVSELRVNELRTRAVASSDPLVISASRRHGSEALETWLRGVNVAGLINIGSSLKFCQVAEGKADVYPRFGPTKEWDTAAGHAIVLAAGGVVTECDGSPLYYGKSEKDFLNPFFIASAARMENLYDPALYAGV
jgi:3'(2'),5'-bisphosphate nucleotidase